jgi:hypothetical protein
MGKERKQSTEAAVREIRRPQAWNVEPGPSLHPSGLEVDREPSLEPSDSAATNQAGGMHPPSGIPRQTS